MVRLRSAAAIAMLACSTAIASAGADVPDYDFNWAIITDPGNPAYDGSLGTSSTIAVGAGSVDHTYRISRLELTSAQWLPFVNTFAQQSDSPFGFGRPSFSGLEPIPGPP
ncbi:MAG: hypothetical protein VYC34_03605, partial [Planctomycetota bacterium]|nr:hypothetical protein [Planctomycetota bacterium]